MHERRCGADDVRPDNSPQSNDSGFQVSQSRAPFSLLPYSGHPWLPPRRQHLLLATVVLSGFVPTSQLTFEASFLPEASFPPSVRPWLPQPSTGMSLPSCPHQNPGHVTCPVMTDHFLIRGEAFEVQPNHLFFRNLMNVDRANGLLLLLLFLVSIPICHERPQMSEVGKLPERRGGNSFEKALLLSRWMSRSSPGSKAREQHFGQKEQHL